MNIFRAFTFDSAHRLPCVPEGHKCSQLHGHTFRVEIHVDDQLDSNRGWVIDFSDISKTVDPIISQLDHKYLNDIEGLENPTSENIAKWIWEKIKPNMQILSKIVVQESPNSGAVYQGEVD